MVLPGEEEDYMTTTTMTKRHERSKILHNFTFSDLKWGNQRILRCKKDDSDSFSGAGEQRLRRRSNTSKFDGGSNNKNRRLDTEPSRSQGIEEFREKIMSDLRTVADKMRESMFRKQGLDDKEEEEPREREVSPPEAPGEAVEARPWNLRKRRAVCKALVREEENQYNHKGLKIEEKRVMYNSNLGNESAKERPKFLSTLSKKEIEDDYMMMTGHRPPRRPKKRLRNVQKNVDSLKPALYFSEIITEDMY